MYYEGVEFDCENKKNIDIEGNEFYSCTFTNVNFQGESFSGVTLEMCRFKSCQFNEVKFEDTKIVEVLFEDCDITSVDFSKINKFVVDFEFKGSYLKYCNLSKLNLSKFKFCDSIIKEVIFYDTNLKEVDFSACDLMGTSFELCNLEKSNFLGAKRYRINPMTNKLKGAKFNIPEVTGLLQELGIKIV
ncbi:MAG: pentapeptide repeat-containing protein [Psychrilyobacter sp.]|nr:pentapeptide repeat-containing protein [Psychrilyobacter sp.]